MNKLLGSLIVSFVCLIMMSEFSLAQPVASHSNSSSSYAYVPWTWYDGCITGSLYVAGGSSRDQLSGHVLRTDAFAEFSESDYCTNMFTYWSGYVDNGVSFSEQTSLNMASLLAAISVTGWTYNGNTDEFVYANGVASVDIKWIGTGAIAKSSYIDRFIDGDSMSIQKSDGGSRQGTANGSVTLDNGTNIVPGEGNGYMFFGKGFTLQTPH